MAASVLGRLLAAVAGVYAGAGLALAQRAAVAAEAAAGQGAAAEQPSRLGLLRWLPAVEAAATTPAMQPVREAFLAYAPAAAWRQNPGYSAATMGEAFMDGYGYVEPLGPGRAVDCAELRIGLLVLGPQLLYPDHAHPAEEIYHVVAGSARWWREGEGWAVHGPGAMIHHPPGIRHAMETAGPPLLALYCWGGQVQPHARLTAKDAR
ncbi:MAG: hypothetical protein OHK0024_25070 [Thalassobaculales bacterium]